ncbi:MAG: hypothetical protein VYA60_04975 [Pseudomonadota bacterium]|nr:hypothetical protein [Pseudomonadota bacterium]
MNTTENATKSNETKMHSQARVIADCPNCGDQCEICDISKDDTFKLLDHCCFKCGQTFSLDI